jgi:hypothetical protein
MNRINTGRQTISAKQCNANYCPSGQIAKHVMDATIEDLTIEQPVKRCQAHESFIVGHALVKNEQCFYLVTSKFAHRFYVVVVHQGQWFCSAKDAEVARKCIQDAKDYRLLLLARRAMLAA